MPPSSSGALQKAFDPEAELSVGHLASAPASTSEETHQCMGPGSLSCIGLEADVKNLSTVHGAVFDKNVRELKRSHSRAFFGARLSQPERCKIQRADRVSEQRAIARLLARGGGTV